MSVSVMCRRCGDERPHKARGLCKKCYDRVLYHRRFDEYPRTTAAHGVDDSPESGRPCFWCGQPYVTPGTAMGRVVAMLVELEGWWSVPQLAERASVNEDTVRRYVYRLNGQLDRRKRGHGFEYRWNV